MGKIQTIVPADSSGEDEVYERNLSPIVTSPKSKFIK